MARRTRDEGRVETAQEAYERQVAEDERKARQFARMRGPMQAAMLRARQRRAFDTQRQLGTIIRYEKEAAVILALLREEMMADGGTLKLVATAPGCEPVDVLGAWDIGDPAYSLPHDSIADGLMRMWRYEMRGRYERKKPAPDRPPE